MKITFLWTKWAIDIQTPAHRYHSSLLIEHKNTRILIDHGELHQKKIKQIKPDAVLITHAHIDHYIRLTDDEKTNIPVYLTQKSYDYGKFTPSNPVIIQPWKSFVIKDVKVLPYSVIHSIKCPALGFKIFFEKKTLIYNPDLIDIVEKEKILKDVDYYIGDGACVTANLVRRIGDTLIGHTKVPTQINWCKKFNVPHVIITHFGKETIRKEQELKKEYPDVVFAYDGMTLKI